jgi:hypothetical protein
MQPISIEVSKLGEFVVPYLEHAKANKRFWLRDEQMLKPLVGFFGAERQLTDISPVDIEGYKLHRRKQVSGSTANRDLALLRRCSISPSTGIFTWGQIRFAK